MRHDPLQNNTAHHGQKNSLLVANKNNPHCFSSPPTLTNLKGEAKLTKSIKPTITVINYYLTMAKADGEFKPKKAKAKKGGSKKPLSGFMLFSKEHRAKIKEGTIRLVFECVNVFAVFFLSMYGLRWVLRKHWVAGEPEEVQG